MSLSAAAVGAKSLAAGAPYFGRLPQRGWAPPNAVQPHGLTFQKRLGRVSVVLRKIVQFLALTLTALALVPSGAHLFALPNKISLAAEQYFIVQNTYRGWSLFGIVLMGALIANLALALLLRGRGAPFVLALFAFLCIALTLVVLVILNKPAKQATHKWTMIPDQWETMRREWGY